MKTIKLLERNLGRKFLDMGFSNDFLDKYAKIRGTKTSKLERKAKTLLPAPGIIGIKACLSTRSVCLKIRVCLLQEQMHRMIR